MRTLLEDLEHERNRRLDLQGQTNQISSERETEIVLNMRSPSLKMRGRSVLFTTSWVKLVRISLVFAGRYPSCGRVLILSTASTRTSWRCSSARSFFTGRNPELMIRPKPADVERRMRSHLTWKFNLVCVASAAKHTEWTDEFG